MKFFTLWGAIGIVLMGVIYWLGQTYFGSNDNGLQISNANNRSQVEIGKLVYAENCASCHGVNLEGQANWRSQLPEGGLPAPPHDETGHTWHHSDQVNFKYTKLGGQKIAPSGFKSNMPGFEGTLSDKQIWAVLAYIKSRWPVQIRRRHDQRSKSK
jgi:mono/diheme cytochrome c family protein